MENGFDMFTPKSPETIETGFKGKVDRGIQAGAEVFVTTVFGRALLEPLTAMFGFSK